MSLVQRQLLKIKGFLEWLVLTHFSSRLIRQQRNTKVVDDSSLVQEIYELVCRGGTLYIENRENFFLCCCCSCSGFGVTICSAQELSAWGLLLAVVENWTRDSHKKKGGAQSWDPTPPPRKSLPTLRWTLGMKTKQNCLRQCGRVYLFFPFFCGGISLGPHPVRFRRYYWLYTQKSRGPYVAPGIEPSRMLDKYLTQCLMQCLVSQESRERGNTSSKYIPQLWESMHFFIPQQVSQVRFTSWLFKFCFAGDWFSPEKWRLSCGWKLGTARRLSETAICSLSVFLGSCKKPL